MNRSLYSGVSGLKASQTRMDVIGNNISNVNTYGFKSSRVTFSDVYYQAVGSGSKGTTTSGGTNPSSIGYGSKVGSIDLNMGQSSFTMTDSSMDLGIDGEGFFQVQDADGNKFYTRTGSLTFDSAGNLVDSKGNFVLGVCGDPLGKTSSSDLIQLSLPSVTPSSSSATTSINDIKYTLSTSKNTSDGNISMQFIQSTDMTDGVRAVAEVGTSGIVVTLNANEKFTSLSDLNIAIKDAIETYMQETTGKSHPAGDFTISMDPASAWQGALTGEEICSTDFALQSGEATGWPSVTMAGGFKPSGTTGSGFSANGDMSAFSVVYKADGTLTVTMTADGKDYKGTIDPSKTEEGTIKLINGSSNSTDYIIMNRPSYDTISDAMKTANISDTSIVDGSTGDLVDGGSWDVVATTSIIASDTSFTPAEESKCLGLSTSKIALKGGTEGGAQGIESLTGISIGSDGTIVASHAQLKDIVVGRIDLVTFANPEGLVQSGGTYFTASENSGKMSSCKPGQDGSGKIVSGSLELSNVDLSQEFADMITTQRGYQACSRMITVSDEMLEELVNLKR